MSESERVGRSPGARTRCRTVVVIGEPHRLSTTLCEYLKARRPDIDVLDASDAAGALEMCRSHLPDCIIVNTGSDGTDGVDMIPILRSVVPHAAVVVVSQYAGLAYARRSAAAGATHYITHDLLDRNLLPALPGAMLDA